MSATNRDTTILKGVGEMEDTAVRAYIEAKPLKTKINHKNKYYYEDKMSILQFSILHDVSSCFIHSVVRNLM
jgi:hypothetical protein